MQTDNLQDTTLFSNSFLQNNDSLAIKVIPYNSQLSLKEIDSLINISAKDTVTSIFPYPSHYLVKDKNTIIKSYTKSIFSPHLLLPKSMQVHEVNSSGGDWIFGIFLLCFILLSWIRIFYKKRLNLIFKTFISQRTTNLLLRDGTLFNERISLALSFIFFSTISMFAYCIYQLATNTEFKPTQGLIIYGQIFLLIFAFIAFKMALVNIIGNVFNNKIKSFEYQINDLIFFQVLGVVLLPIVLFYSYLHTLNLLYIATSIMFLWYIYKLLRDLFIGITHSKFSLFYLFLYFCTVEILPLLVLIKLAMKY